MGTSNRSCSAARPPGTANGMEALFFNVRPIFLPLSLSKGSTYAVVYSQVDTGFLEGIVRGYKAGILTQSHYANLTQCETLEGAYYSTSARATYLDDVQTSGLSSAQRIMATSWQTSPFRCQHPSLRIKQLRFWSPSSTICGRTR